MDIFKILPPLLFVCVCAVTEEPAQDRDFWYAHAKATIEKRLQHWDSQHSYSLYPGYTPPLLKAKNVVLFIGDGMSLATATAARILRGQRQGKQGEDQELIWDTFPATALAKTYNADAQTGESSACATALLCGVKANYETLGLDARGKLDNCFSGFTSRVTSVFDWAQQAGKATGVVTTTRITHATPAAGYAHSPSRYWEDDSKVPSSSRKSCKDIARQLVENDPGRNLNVILGGGRRHFLPKVARDPEEPSEEGRRLDGRNLIDDWLRDKKKRNLRGQYFWNKGQLDEMDTNVEYVLGLFAYSHMDFETDRVVGPNGDPSLADMTRSALTVLRKNPKGFVLVVEGGRIDHGHHYNNAYRALDEALALETAVLTAAGLLDGADTLMVVTADHSHVMTMGGQATPRGHPLLGPDVKPSDVDGLPYSTVLYGNGPGHSTTRAVPGNSTGSAEINAVHGAAVPRQWATHGAEDVPVYATGPLATALFGGVVDQSFIPHALAYAACIGEYAQRCDNHTTSVPNQMPICKSDTGSGLSVPGSVPVAEASSVMADQSNRRKADAKNNINNIINGGAQTKLNLTVYIVSVMAVLMVSVIK